MFNGQEGKNLIRFCLPIVDNKQLPQYDSSHNIFSSLDSFAKFRYFWYVLNCIQFGCNCYMPMYFIYVTLNLYISCKLSLREACLSITYAVRKVFPVPRKTYIAQFLRVIFLEKPSDNGASFYF